jgi:hypothetical protein
MPRGSAHFLRIPCIFVDYDGKVLTKADYLARVKANSTHVQQIVADGMSGNYSAPRRLWSALTGSKAWKTVTRIRGAGALVTPRVVNDGNWICIAAATTPILH